MKAHRFVLTHDFGYIALNILYIYPEDSGTYTLVVKNRSGECQSSVNIDCAVKDSMVSFSCSSFLLQFVKFFDTGKRKI